VLLGQQQVQQQVEEIKRKKLTVQSTQRLYEKLPLAKPRTALGKNATQQGSNPYALGKTGDRRTADEQTNGKTASSHKAPAFVSRTWISWSYRTCKRLLTVKQTDGAVDAVVIAVRVDTRPRRTARRITALINVCTNHVWYKPCSPIYIGLHGTNAHNVGYISHRSRVYCTILFFLFPHFSFLFLL